eukprot:CAMPEP_0173280588 /NCGR_PEP_ID=MMETSP1143-20121109/5772_1 /TAXON_ID=483371 /ORGANISM="non described non described, Strain CCMP2298" /LENGTH=355 /DNA_ID=CAMNT_0014217913 /DNA_START=40 /DNA_END=1107 /DNA_ORIENTATION=-
MMIARLALLLVAVAVASAENLRTESHDVPLDNARGARVLARMQQKAATKPTNAVSHILGAEELKMDHEALKKHLLAKGGRRLQREEALDFTWIQVTKKGSLVTRSRPNSDCSGVIVEIGVDPVGTCHNFGAGFSVMEGIYTSKEGDMTLVVGFFETSDNCSGEPAEFFQGGPTVKDCQLLADQIVSTGPLMGGTMLTSKTPAQMAEGEKPGFMVSNYEESDCSGDMTGYTLYRNDACHLVIEFNNDDNDDFRGEGPIRIQERRLQGGYLIGGRVTPDSTFSYVKVDKCQGKTVHITGYTDSACTRKSYRAEVDLDADQESSYDNYLQCRYNSNFGPSRKLQEGPPQRYSMGSCSN